MADVSRRRFLGEALAGVTAFIAVGCSPRHRKANAPRTVPSTTHTPFEPGFGGRIDAGPIDRIRASIAGKRAPYYVPEARAYVSPFPTELADRARATYPAEVFPLLADGLIVIYQRCTHLGCRVPWCPTSQWFECACHDAMFDRVGEYRRGPAPRGLDLMKASIEHDRLVIDSGTILQGLPNGTNTTHQAPAGPFCV